jgi:hypothetical protein
MTCNLNLGNVKQRSHIGGVFLPMTKRFHRWRLSWFLVWAGTIVVNALGIASGREQPPNVKKLVDESSTKNAIDESTLLNENPLRSEDLPQALDYIKKHADYSSYYLLMAVRKYYPASYKDVSDEDKGDILCSALKNSKSLNDWGFLTPSMSYDGESALALLETGKAALKPLIAILDDRARAPLFGSEEATMSRSYQYRRKDFAYRYVSLILGETPHFREAPTARDKDIEALKSKLKKEAR